MAASAEDWRDKLKVHPICKRLKEIVSKQSQYAATGDVKRLLAVKNGDLFVWDSYNSNIIHCNLKSLLSVSQPKDDHHSFQVCLEQRLSSRILMCFFDNLKYLAILKCV